MKAWITVLALLLTAALANERAPREGDQTKQARSAAARRVSPEAQVQRESGKPRDGDRPLAGNRPRDGDKRDRARSPETGRFMPERAAGKSSEAPAKATPTSTKHVFHPLRKPALSDTPATREQAIAAVLKAVRFFYEKVARHGGYLWEYSGDLTLREAEGPVEDGRVWVQPPGTPTIGEAFLDAYETTGEEVCLDAAMDAARVLIRGQFHTGGWDYSVTTEPGDKRPVRTTLDDDTTQAATRFLMRLDEIEARYNRLAAADPASLSKLEASPGADLEPQARLILACLDERGAWLEAGPLRFHRIEPQSGVIRCQTFAENIEILCRFIARSAAARRGP
jgi:hypothetical protein